MLGLGVAVVPLDTAVNISFPDITGSFGLPISMIQWVVICYVLTYSALMLAFGRIGDIALKQNALALATQVWIRLGHSRKERFGVRVQR